MVQLSVVIGPAPEIVEEGTMSKHPPEFGELDAEYAKKPTTLEDIDLHLENIDSRLFEIRVATDNIKNS